LTFFCYFDLSNLIRHSITQQELLAANQGEIERDVWSFVGPPSSWNPKNKITWKLLARPFMYSFTGSAKTRRLHLRIAHSGWSEGISLTSSVGTTGEMEVIINMNSTPSLYSLSIRLQSMQMVDDYSKWLLMQFVAVTFVGIQ
jgi:hypothetical protein